MLTLLVAMTAPVLLGMEEMASIAQVHTKSIIASVNGIIYPHKHYVYIFKFIKILVCIQNVYFVTVVYYYYGCVALIQPWQLSMHFLNSKKV